MALVVMHTRAGPARQALVITIVERRPCGDAAAETGLTPRHVRRLTQKFRQRLAEAARLSMGQTSDAAP